MAKVNRQREDHSKAKLESVTFSPEKLKEISQSLVKFRADLMFSEKQRAFWTSKYPDCWIVVKDLKLVGYGKNRQRLYQRLRRKGVDLSGAVVKFLDTKPRRWFLLKVA